MTDPKQSNPEPTRDELLGLAEELIREQNTMTLATAKKGDAWAAPVYYVFHKSSFFFFSDPRSRHIQETVGSHQASAAIHAFSSGWADIRGIQMSGHIEMVGAGIKAIQAIRAYLRRFPFTKEFFKPGEIMDMGSFEKRFRVRLYRFKPHLVYYLDNRIRFGFRQEVAFR